MLDLQNPNPTQYTHASISVSTTYEGIASLMNKIRDLINSYSFVEVVVGTEYGLIKYNFECGVATRYPEDSDSEIHAELNRIIGLKYYRGNTKFSMVIPVTVCNISAEDQYRHIQQWLNTYSQPLYVTLSSGVVHNREHWERALSVKPAEIQGRVVGALLEEGKLYCTVDFDTTDTVKQILESSPPILAGMYAMIEGRCTKLIRMYVRPKYTHERMSENA